MSEHPLFNQQHPFDLFTTWFEAAKKHQSDPTEMALATVDNQHCPHIRMVLLKKFSSDGFVFFTNLNSHKAQQLQHNPNASLCFYWNTLQRQVRITGTVESISDLDADAYFATRNKDSQISAWASKQSQPLEHPDILQQRIQDIELQFEHQTAIKRPPFWSGFCVKPKTMEFWHQGDNRRHQRLYFKKKDHQWISQYLYP